MTETDIKILVAVLGAFISLIIAVINYLATQKTQAEVEAQKAGFAKELETMKGEIAQKKSEGDARRDYEYEARKRLYQECEPLLFQLYELSENALHRIYGLARTARIGKLESKSSWLAGQGYYMASTIYNLLAPAAVYKLIQRRLTFVDLTVEPRVRSHYILAKLISWSFTDAFEFARCEPKQDYDPDVSGWIKLRKNNPEQYWRQGVPVGRLDVAAEGLIIREAAGSLRLRSFGEFETEYYDQNSPIGAGFSILTDMFLHFHPKARPVLWRMLVSQAHIYEALLEASEKGVAEHAVSVKPFPENKRGNFDWRSKNYGATDEAVLVEPFAVAVEYLKAKLGAQFIAGGNGV